MGLNLPTQQIIEFMMIGFTHLRGFESGELMTYLAPNLSFTHLRGFESVGRGGGI